MASVADPAVAAALAAAMKTNHHIFKNDGKMSSGSQVEVLNATIPGPNRDILKQMQGNGNRKRPTPVCIFWYQAECAKGNNCVFAHPQTHYGIGKPKPPSAPVQPPVQAPVVPAVTPKVIPPRYNVGVPDAVPSTMAKTAPPHKPVESGVDTAAVSNLSFLAASQSAMDKEARTKKEEKDKPKMPVVGYAAARASVMGRPMQVNSSKEQPAPAAPAKRSQELKGVFMELRPKTKKPEVMQKQAVAAQQGKSAQRLPSNVIKILGLPLATAESMVVDECSKYGTVIEATLTEESAGPCAVVSFASIEMATAAIKAMHGTLLFGAIVPLAVTFHSEDVEAKPAQPAKEPTKPDILLKEQKRDPSRERDREKESSKDDRSSRWDQETRRRDRSRDRDREAPKNNRDAEPKRRSFRDRSRSRSRDDRDTRRRYRERSRSRSPRPEPKVKKRPGSNFDVAPAVEIPAAPGAKAPDAEARQVSTKGHWAQYMLSDGRTYFHNLNTKETTWDKPADFAVAPSRRVGDHISGIVAAQPGQANLFLYNLPLHWSDQDLINAFSPFGKIVRMTIQRHPGGFSKGFGFCAYEKQEEAQLAIQTMNGARVEGNKLQVSLQSIAGLSTKASMRA